MTRVRIGEILSFARMTVAGRMRWRAELVAAALAVAAPLACSGRSSGVDPAACGQPTDGTRLAAFYLDGEDGSREYFDVWYDRTLHDMCRFQLATDGQTRCMPFDSTLGFAYLDAACTQRSTTGYPEGCLAQGLGPPRYALDLVGIGECSESFRVFTLGPGTVPATLYGSSNGACAAATVPEDPATIRYPLRDEVPLASMVAAEVRLEGQRLQTSYAAAEDGAHGRVHRLEDRGTIFDSAQGVDCDVQVAADGVERCLPASSRSVLVTGGFSDAQCTQPIAVDDRSTCDAASGAPGWRADVVIPPPPPPGACPDPPIVHLHALTGATTRPGIYYSPIVGVCLERTSTSGDAVSTWDVLPELAPSTFVAVDEKIQKCGPTRTSGNRLEAHYETSEDGLEIEGGFWFDTRLGVACRFVIAADGRSRCLPIDQTFNQTFNEHYSDPACTRPLLTADPCPVDDPKPAQPMFGVIPAGPGAEPVGSCLLEDDATRYFVYRLGEPLATGNIYEPLPGGRCQATPIETLDPTRRFYPLGEEVPPAMMVGGTYRRLPR